MFLYTGWQSGVFRGNPQRVLCASAPTRRKCPAEVAGCAPQQPSAGDGAAVLSAREAEVLVIEIEVNLPAPRDRPTRDVSIEGPCDGSVCGEHLSSVCACELGCVPISVHESNRAADSCARRPIDGGVEIVNSCDLGIPGVRSGAVTAARGERKNQGEQDGKQFTHGASGE